MTAFRIDLDAIAEKAASFSLVRALLAIPATLLYIVGTLAAVVFLVLAWMWAALVVGFTEGRERANRTGE